MIFHNNARYLSFTISKQKRTLFIQKTKFPIFVFPLISKTNLLSGWSTTKTIKNSSRYSIWKPKDLMLFWNLERKQALFHMLKSNKTSLYL